MTPEEMYTLLRRYGVSQPRAEFIVGHVAKIAGRYALYGALAGFVTACMLIGIGTL